MASKQTITEIQDAYRAYSLKEANSQRLEQAWLWLKSLEFPEVYATEALDSLMVLVDMKAEEDTLLASLLYHACVIKLITPNMVKARFGDKVAWLLQKVLEIENIDTRFLYSLKRVKTVLEIGAVDVRILFIELSHKLVQLRNSVLSKATMCQQRGQDTLWFLAPLARRLGAYAIKNELEDLAFEILYPEEHQKVRQYYEPRWAEQSQQWRSLLVNLKDLLDRNEIPVTMQMRRKNLYSIYRKIQRQNLFFSDLYDVLACRLITDSASNCYNVLRILAESLSMGSQHFKDFIQNPKSNGYQSLHISLISSTGLLFEVQIRTSHMHQIAEYGLARHWQYKHETQPTPNQDISQLDWVYELLKQIHGQDEQSALDSLQHSLDTDKV